MIFKTWKFFKNYIKIFIIIKLLKIKIEIFRQTNFINNIFYKYYKNHISKSSIIFSAFLVI